MKYHHFYGQTILKAILIWIYILFSITYANETHSINNFLRLEIDSSINPATLNYIQYNTQQKEYDAIILSINTPGGILSTTKEIITTLSKTNKPIIVWIGPSGASATSAGAIIASSAHLIYMAEGTNIGAATPISTTGDLDKKSDMRQKAVNDIKALVRAQAQKNFRNYKPFEDMITTAQSYSANEAIDLKIVNGIANSIDEVILNLQGKEIHLDSQTVNLKVLGSYKIIDAHMDLGQKVLNILSDPSLAYILFLLGAALLYIEFQAPGGYISGSVGVVSLIIAAIGMQVLPLNAGALALILCAVVLLILEVYITSFGLLTIAALACLIFGSLFLYRTDDSYLSLSLGIIMSVVSAIGVFISLVLYVILKSQKNIGKQLFNQIDGEEGVVISHLSDTLYSIKIKGEIWKASSKIGLNGGDKVRVLCKNEDLTVSVEKTKGTSND
ncbi:nodulation protein NfeD [Bacteriovorax sp. Seq25_V]|uniref:NfeD family protein n=1 Tax=Bacteriovorax sp. Seq25_V TaxID=1201288 RepID=UPI00038A0D8D|nr:NfeD family protein [Bacteriovorax sp. Seq25_V]EQC44880.1 nodulation efficiency protein NfeD [Bacteriovorax sp. Seq25_V]